MAENVLAASRMGLAVLTDPQFNLPNMPKLVEGLVRIPTADTLLIEGGPSRQSFRGALAAKLLPELMDCLVGRRTVEELTEDGQAPAEQVLSMLALLYSTGLIEEGDPELAGMLPPDVPKASAAYLSRSIDTTRVNNSAAQAHRRLTSTTVLVVGMAGDPLTEHLVASLDEDHLTVTRAECPVASGDAPALLSGVDFLVAIGDGPALEELCHGARGAGVTVLPVLPVDGTLLIGPELGLSHRVCASCVFSQRAALPSAADARRSPLRQSRARLALAASLVTREVSALISRVGTSETGRSLIALDLDGWSQERFSLPPLPGCPICMDDVLADGGSTVPLAWAYEESVAFPARDSCDPKAHQVHYKAGNIDLQRRNRRWLSAPSTPLPEPTALGPGFPSIAAASSSASWDAARLATLLTRTAGLRERVTPATVHVARWCASGGNLGSVNAYVVARSIAGLEPGVYAYQRHDDSLALLPWASPVRAVAGPEDGASAHIILTGSLDVVGQKYGPFAWRIVHLDAGAAVAQAALVATQLGLHLSVQPIWNDDAIADLIGADHDLEPVTGVLHLHTNRTRS